MAHDSPAAALRTTRVHFAALGAGQPNILALLARGGPVPETAEGERFFELARWFALSITPCGFDDSEVVIAAEGVSSADQMAALDQSCHDAGKRFVVIDFSDPMTPVRLRHGLAFRCSIDARRRHPCEHGAPALVGDVWIEAGRPPPRSWSARPGLGFVGYASTPVRRLLIALRGDREKFRGLSLRAKALQSLRRHPDIDCRFVQRSQFWGGAAGPDDRRRVRAEFLHNLADCDYALCLRGKGNFSFRLYEVLATGRVPLLINTDCVLPAADRIDWKQHVVWVEGHELNRAGDMLLDHHRRLDETGLAAMQQANRRLWQERLSPVGFFRDVIDRALAPQGDPGDCVETRVRFLHEPPA